jgi:hypothetical protein
MRFFLESSVRLLVDFIHITAGRYRARPWVSSSPGHHDEGTSYDCHSICEHKSHASTSGVESKSAVSFFGNDSEYR